jgi:orotidine-5'-phosphate decarboxylase
MAKMADRLKVDGIVAPSTRPERLKEIKSIAKDAFVISPGVGAQGGNLKDVLNVLNENDYVIIGRAIYENENPKNAAKKYKIQM